MFKPQINVSLTRKKADKAASVDEAITETINSIDWERIATLAQETAKKVVVIGLAAYAAKKTIDTSSEIAIVAAQAHFNN